MRRALHAHRLPGQLRLVLPLGPRGRRHTLLHLGQGLRRTLSGVRSWRWLRPLRVQQGRPLFPAETAAPPPASPTAAARPRVTSLSSACPSFSSMESARQSAPSKAPTISQGAAPPARRSRSHVHSLQAHAGPSFPSPFFWCLRSSYTVETQPLGRYCTVAPSSGSDGSGLGSRALARPADGCPLRLPFTLSPENASCSHHGFALITAIPASRNDAHHHHHQRRRRHGHGCHRPLLHH